MRSLIIAGYGVKVGYRKGMLVVEGNGSKNTISLVDLEQVIIVTGGVSITSRAVRAMIEHGVDLVFLGPRGIPLGRVYPPFINRTVNTRRQQYIAYNNSVGVEVAKAIAEAKIRNQAGLLRRFARGIGDYELRELSYRVQGYIDELRRVEAARVDEVRKIIVTIEAKAARVYWAGVAKLVPGDMGFEFRNQDGVDLFNIMLNYGYGIIYGECWRALVLAGLDPYAGYLHTDRSGKPTLAFDYIEMFRCSTVDYPLLLMVRRGWRPQVENGLLIAKSRGEIAKRVISNLDRKVRVKGELLTLGQALKRWAFKLASYIRGDTREYKGFIEDW